MHSSHKFLGGKAQRSSGVSWVQAEAGRHGDPVTAEAHTQRPCAQAGRAANCCPGPRWLPV